MRSFANCKRGVLLSVVATALLFVAVAQASPDEANAASGVPIWIYDSDFYVQHVAVADLNGDLVDDVIAGEYSSDYYGYPQSVIAIDGTDGDTLWTYLCQDGIRSMAVGDINGDEVADVVAGASYNGSNTPDGYVHAINGVDGTSLWQFYVGSTINTVAIGDFNGDSYMDVAAGCFDDYIYAIDGEHGTQLWSKNIGSLWINEVSTGDVNGDNLDDVAFAHEYLANYDNFCGVIDGSNGNFIWEDTVSYVVTTAKLADVDDDGQLEAIFGGLFSDNHAELYVRTSLNGDIEWSYDLGPCDHVNSYVVVGIYDIDQDTDLDMVVGLYIGSYNLLAFDGNSSTPMWTSETLDGYPRDLAFGDVDGNGEVNIIAACFDRVQVLQASTGKKFWYYSVGGTMSSVAAADVDQDGITDVIAGGGADNVGTPPNPGKSVWALKTSVSPVCWEHTFGEYGNELTLANLDGDEYLDPVAVASVEDAAFAVNGATGSALWTWPGTANLYAVTSGDLNDDGFDEVVVGGADDQITAIDHNGSTMWTYPTGDQIYRKCLQTADLNGDGAADVIAGADDNIVRALNGPDGDTLWTYNIGGEVGEVRVYQMNGTGPLDVVVAGANGANSVVVIDGSDGSLLWSYAASSEVEHVVPFDANSDGIPDVAIAQTPFGPKQVAIVDGANQTIIWSQPISAASNTHGMSQGKLNGDKYPDLVVPGNSTDRVIWALSGDDGDTLWTHPVGGEVNCVLVSDVDYDGQNEVVAGSDDQIVYVLNGADGSEEWSYSTADDVMDVKVGFVCDPILPSIACVTFGSDGVVYAFSSLATGPLNQPPATPGAPTGPVEVPAGVLQQYVATTTDPEDDQVFYGWDFGDTDTMFWAGPYNSGDTCMYGYAWVAAGTYDVTVYAKDDMDAESGASPALQVTVYICGDVTGDGIANISDAVSVISYIFGGGAAPDPLLSGDADCNGLVNISDAVFLISYIFGGGPAPCADCP
jgi:outer membrane protein assembly factor BamB